MISFCGNVIWFLLALAGGSWMVLFFLLSPVLPEPLNIVVAVVVGVLLLLSIATWRLMRWLRITVVLLSILAGALWSSLTPSNARVWPAELAKEPRATIVGDEVTIANVRNFNYRSETDFDPRYETRTVRVSDLTEVDIVVSYWAGKEIAHIITSFGFKDGTFLAVSIETRREAHESYSPLKGFFRNYELLYVVADERDVLGVRAIHRNPIERVHILRTAIALQNGRKLFLEYMNKINGLADNPTFYNTLTTNCTTQVLWHAQAFGSEARYDWRVLLSGYIPEYLARNDVLVSGQTVEQIMQDSLVTPVIQNTPLDENFSLRIRHKVPLPLIREVPEGRRPE